MYKYCTSVPSSILKGYWPNMPFSTDFSLTWEWDSANSFDVGASFIQITPAQYALSLTWELCTILGVIICNSTSVVSSSFELV